MLCASGSTCEASFELRSHVSCYINVLLDSLAPGAPSLAFRNVCRVTVEHLIGQLTKRSMHTWAALARFLGAAAAPVVLTRFGPSQELAVAGPWK